MNKLQLADAIALEAGISRIDAKKSLDAFISLVSSALYETEKVTLSGFGTFLIEKKNARMGRDPRNGAPIKIAAKHVVKFRPSPELSDRIR